MRRLHTRPTPLLGLVCCRRLRSWATGRTAANVGADISCFSCNITLSSWAIDNRLLELDFDGTENFRFSTFSESNEWLLVDSSASMKIERYPCGNAEIMEFNQLVYSMTIRRCVGFYVYALLIPSVLLSFLMPLMFWIPTTGDGRITLGIGLFPCFYRSFSFRLF